MSIHPWQIAAGVVVGIVIGGVAVYQVGHDPIRRIISDAVASFNQLTDSETRPSAPLSEKEQQLRISGHRGRRFRLIADAVSG
jgi:hypothetical protein